MGRRRPRSAFEIMADFAFASRKHVKGARPAQHEETTSENIVASAEVLSKAQRRAVEQRIAAERLLEEARTLEERLAAEVDQARVASEEATAQRLLAVLDELAARERVAQQRAESCARELERFLNDRTEAEIRKRDDETLQNAADANVIACEARLAEALEEQRRAREAFTESNRRLDWVRAGEESVRSELTTAEQTLWQRRLAREEVETELRIVRKRIGTLKGDA